MNSNARSTLIGAGVGAGLMFMLDPARGARRRALVRDKMVRAARKTRDAVSATRRDVGNRMVGIQAELRAVGSDNADDRIIHERVRAELGRVASHSRAISLDVRDRFVTLSGDVLASEVSPIVSAIEKVRGVEGVRNEMTVHLSADGVPSLQGRSRRPGRWTTWLVSGWSPTAMLVAGAGTAALAVAATAARKSAA
jgi:hypothetical protein